MIVVAGCAGLEISGRPSKQSTELRVGVTPNYPPIIYRQDGKIAGLEAELAWPMAQRMERKLRFATVKWEQQTTCPPGRQNRHHYVGHDDHIRSGSAYKVCRTISANRAHGGRPTGP